MLSHSDYLPLEVIRAHQIEICAADRAPQLPGLLFIDESGQDMHAMTKTVSQPLVDVPFADLCPGNAALQSLMEQYR